MVIKLNPAGKLLISIGAIVETASGTKHEATMCKTASCYSQCSLRLTDACETFACGKHENPDRIKIVFTKL